MICLKRLVVNTDFSFVISDLMVSVRPTLVNSYISGQESVSYAYLSLIILKVPFEFTNTF